MHVNKQLKTYISNAVKPNNLEEGRRKEEEGEGSYRWKSRLEEVNCNLRLEEGNDGNNKKEDVKSK